MLPIPVLTDVQMAFPANPPLPDWATIPQEFREGRTPFNEIASRLFFQGGALADYGLTPKPGVNLSEAVRALRACLGSFSPKHEHKEAGVAYMLSEWFDHSPPSLRKEHHT